MAKIRFRDIDFNADTLDEIARMNKIVEKFGRVSVRQLFYAFVTQNWIRNEQKEYKRIQDIVSKARYAGMLDWDLIEDRNRETKKPRDWQSGAAALEELQKEFRLDRWADQPFYVEIAIEKAALASVLVPVSDTFHVPMTINRGYNSASAMKESADRIRYRCSLSRARPVLIYLGDHDPSGLDMGKRDIYERMTEFGCPDYLDVRMIALTMDQIEEYKCPSNPLKRKKGKISDSRARAYAEKYGDSSWELDALPPNVLEDMLAAVVRSYIDKDKMDAVVAKEVKIKQALKKVAATLPK